MAGSLEERVAALEQALQGLAETRSADPSAGPTDEFWLLSALKEQAPVDAVVFGGTATLPEGPVSWQWGAATEQVREAEWEPAAAVLDALSHPVRLRLLQRILNGTATTAELAADETLGTTGQLHHHLRALVAAGWLASAGRGHWHIPAARVIPLLIVIVATTPR